MMVDNDEDSHGKVDNDDVDMTLPARVRMTWLLILIEMKTFMARKAMMPSSLVTCLQSKPMVFKWKKTHQMTWDFRCTIHPFTGHAFFFLKFHPGMNVQDCSEMMSLSWYKLFCTFSAFSQINLSDNAQKQVKDLSKWKWNTARSNQTIFCLKWEWKALNGEWCSSTGRFKVDISNHHIPTAWIDQNKNRKGNRSPGWGLTFFSMGLGGAASMSVSSQDSV